MIGCIPLSARAYSILVFDKFIVVGAGAARPQIRPGELTRDVIGIRCVHSESEACPILRSQPASSSPSGEFPVEPADEDSIDEEAAALLPRSRVRFRSPQFCPFQSYRQIDFEKLANGS